MVYDPNTLSNINEVQTAHLELNLKVDFEHKVLDGTVILSLITIVDEVHKVTLDTKYLNVKSVSQAGKQLEVQYNVRLCVLQVLHVKTNSFVFFFLFI